MRKLLIKETKSSSRRVAVRTQKNDSINSTPLLPYPWLLLWVTCLTNGGGCGEFGPAPGFHARLCYHSHSSITTGVRPFDEHSGQWNMSKSLWIRKGHPSFSPSLIGHLAHADFSGHLQTAHGEDSKTSTILPTERDGYLSLHTSILLASNSHNG